MDLKARKEAFYKDLHGTTILETLETILILPV